LGSEVFDQYSSLESPHEVPEIAVSLTAHTDLLFQTLIAAASDGIIVMSHEGRIEVYNAACERLFGYSAEEVIGKNVNMLMPSPFREKHDGEKRNIGMCREVVGLHKDGSTFPIYLSVEEAISGGQPIYLGIIHDLTERKRWQAALIEREARPRSMLNAGVGTGSEPHPSALPISIDELQAERNLRVIAEVGEVLATTLEFEDTLTNIAQLVVDNLADLCIINLIDDDGVARRARVFCRDPTKAWVCDTLMRMPPGHEHVRNAQSVLETRKPTLIAEVTPELIQSWAASDEHLVALRSIAPRSALIAPLLVHGKLLGALSLMSSSRRYGLDDLSVAETIAGRSAFFLENARLYREAKRATTARDHMFRVVAHDLGNPLAAIQMLVTLLGRTGHDREANEEIVNATNRMSRLVRDLIDVTRLRAGSLRLNPTTLNAVEIACETQAAHRPLASSAALEIRFEGEANLPTIWADHDRVLQVFENLIGNAIKFTKPGGRITLGASTRTGEVLFSVSDTGCGIPSDQLPHVFDLFWQAPGQAANRGVGLGLPIVREIVEAHGGRVSVESLPGRGSTFFFTVPVADREQPRPDSRYRPEVALGCWQRINPA
jgi:PAS domain S-box-containing protein